MVKGLSLLSVWTFCFCSTGAGTAGERAASLSGPAVNAVSFYQEGIRLTFPAALSQPVLVEVPRGRTVTITERGPEAATALRAADNQTWGSSVDAKLLSMVRSGPVLAVYKTPDGRRTDIYARSKDHAREGAAVFKHWVLFASGTGTETLSYALGGARVVIDQDGSARIFAGPDSRPAADKPDLVIPRPYILDRDLARVDLSWAWDEKAALLTARFNIPREAYPVAFDPTVTTIRGAIKFHGTAASSGKSVANAGTAAYLASLFGTPALALSLRKLRSSYSGNAILAVKSSTSTLSPTGDGDKSGTFTYTSGSTGWDLVDESSADDADYFTSPTAATAYYHFTFTSPGIPAAATITSLTVYVRGMDGASGTNNIRPAIKVNGTRYNAASGNNPGAAFATYSSSWTTNPATGSAWTVNDINGTGSYPLQQFGVYHSDANPAVRTSWISAVVTYDDQQNIGFMANGSLDTASLASFAGSGDVYVDTWYGQDATGFNAVQHTSTQRPKIVSAGTVYTDGDGRPYMLFDGTDDAFSVSSFTMNYSTMSAHIMLNRDVQTDNRMLLEFKDYGYTAGGFYFNQGEFLRTDASGTGQVGSSLDIATGTLLVASGIYNAANGPAHYENSTLEGSNPPGTLPEANTLTDTLYIFGRQTTIENVGGRLYEVILYDNQDNTSDLSSIVDNMTNAWPPNP
ncbi:MAG: hypothetical protein HGA80_09325 [Candidatus Omnitrophica bacterium]|nr:hypothetical protein [Candidatus Omnitrophota bacterium]